MVIIFDRKDEDTVVINFGGTKVELTNDELDILTRITADEAGYNLLEY